MSLLTLKDQWLLVMDEFGQLNKTDQFYLQQILKGEQGEEIFYNEWILNFLDPNLQVYRDFWFEVNHQFHQIDYIIYNNHELELINVKNYEGIIKFEEANFYINDNEVNVNILEKANEHLRFMRSWLKKYNLSETVINNNLIFIHEHSKVIASHPISVNHIERNEIRNYLQSLRVYPPNRSSKQLSLALTNNQTKCPHLPSRVEKQFILAKPSCPVCLSKSLIVGLRHFECACGYRLSKERYAVEGICKYGVLYHHKELFITDVWRFFGGLFGKQYVYDCLKRHFIKLPKGYKNPRRLFEYHFPNLIFRYDDSNK